MYEQPPPPVLGDQYESIQNGGGGATITTMPAYYFEPNHLHHHHQQQLSNDYQYQQLQQQQQQRLIYSSAQQIDNTASNANNNNNRVMRQVSGGGNNNNSGGVAMRANYLLYGRGNPCGMMPRATAAAANSCNNDSPRTGGTGNSIGASAVAAVASINGTSTANPAAASGTMTRNVFGYDECYKTAPNTAGATASTCFASASTTSNNPASFCLEANQNAYMQPRQSYNCMANENISHQNNPYFPGRFVNSMMINHSLLPKMEDCSPEPTDFGSDYFCSVPGRLSLLSSTSKYKVSVAEIHRRISQPECLNASLLGGILRRAKSKNGGKLLRQRLESIGVKLPAGRRKAATITVLTAMVEGEALQLASDFDNICKADFPTKDCADYLRKRTYSKMIESTEDGCVDDPVLREAKIARKFAEDFLQLLHDDRSPTTIRNEIPILEESVQRPLTRFSMMTHGFGIPAMITTMEAYVGYLVDLEDSLISKSLKRSNHGESTNVPSKRKRLIPEIDQFGHQD